MFSFVGGRFSSLSTSKMVQFFFTTILCSLVHSIAFLKLSFGADHTLLHNQTIAVEQTLVSENKIFELGFFRPGKSRNIYLGIWYKATPDIVVWVANGNNPITHSQGVVLAISQNGTLAICRVGSVIWSANPSPAALRPSLRLLHTGNLVVVDNDDTMEGFLWQSFDYPTDTWLPGMGIVDDVDAGVERYFTSWRNTDDPSPGDFTMRIENQGLADVVIFRGTKKRYRFGQWNGIYLGGVPPFPNAIIKPEIVFRGERMISMSWPYESSLIARVTLDISGLNHRYTMNARKDKWSPVYTYPRDQCDEYGHCGPNGICTMEKAQRCECLRGFSPKFQNDWNLQDWSQGCTRKPLNCQSGDGFQEIRGVKYPDMLRFWLNTSMSLDECKAECLKNCSCTACANPYITNGGSGCLMWLGDLIDTRELSTADSMQNIYIRVPVSELVPLSTNLEEEKKRPLMKMTTVLEATDNFSGEKMIGEGGFGPVYKIRIEGQFWHGPSALISSWELQGDCYIRVEVWPSSHTKQTWIPASPSISLLSLSSCPLSAANSPDNVCVATAAASLSPSTSSASLYCSLLNLGIYFCW